MDTISRSKTMKFTCYFCQKVIENETEIGHTSVCSKVLIPCPNKCGSYVARASLPKHQNECINQRRSPLYKSNANSLTTSAVVHHQSDAYKSGSLDRNGTSKSHLHEEISRLSRKIALLEMQQSSVNTKTQNPNSSPFKSLSERIDDLKNHVNQHSLSIEKHNYQNNFVQEWKKNFENQLETLKANSKLLEKIVQDSDLKWHQMQEHVMNLEKIVMDYNYFREAVSKDFNNFKDTQNELLRNFEAIRCLFQEQIVSISNTMDTHRQEVESVSKNVDELRRNNDEQRAKLSSIIFDVRASSQIASEAAEKIEIQEREIFVMRKDVSQMKVDLEIIEDLTNSGCDVTSFNGNILWKITEFDSKMRRAKENDIILKSPVFYTHRYGYKVRILLYLNGLKKWKDRYALSCIHVLKGEYDMLLAWPCSIEGSITLRDLENILNPKLFKKSIKAKQNFGDEECEEPQESSSTYIFIPHNVLLKDTYLKNDTVFLEVQLKSKEKVETSL